MTILSIVFFTSVVVSAIIHVVTVGLKEHREMKDWKMYKEFLNTMPQEVQDAYEEYKRRLSAACYYEFKDPILYKEAQDNLHSAMTNLEETYVKHGINYYLFSEEPVTPSCEKSNLEKFMDDHQVIWELNTMFASFSIGIVIPIVITYAFCS